MRVEFAVLGIPPKKDGANSMWRKNSELQRLKALRIAAHRAIAKPIPASAQVKLTLRVRAPKAAGDLDNFITGICDGLMAAHPVTPIDGAVWEDVPMETRPDRAIGFVDDSCICFVTAERSPLPDSSSPSYDISLEWDPV